jgi:hypothetical protein
MFYVSAIDRKTGHTMNFGPYETEAEANIAAHVGRRRGENVAWYVEPLHPPAEGGDPHGAFVVLVPEAWRVTGPFSNSAAARAWRRKNKPNHAHIFSLIDKVPAGFPRNPKRRVWV